MNVTSYDYRPARGVELFGPPPTMALATLQTIDDRIWIGWFLDRMLELDSWEQFLQAVRAYPVENIFHNNKTTYDRGYEFSVEVILRPAEQRHVLRTLMRLGLDRWGAPSANMQAMLLAISDTNHLEMLFDQMSHFASWEELLEPV